MTATETGSGWVGRSYKRKEDHRLTTGKGQYFGDIAMPGEDGISLARHLRETYRCGIIMVTASDTVVDRIVGLTTKRVLAAMKQAANEGKGAVSLDGRLIDLASIRQAEVMVQKADEINARS